TAYALGDLGNWVNAGDGYGGGTAINQSNPNLAYVSSENLQVLRTADGFKTMADISPQTVKGERLPFVAPLVINPGTGDLFTGTNILYQWQES
ncbi:hypothetical protein ABTN76_19585, partial [Acinetobacter baumannii]